MDNKTLVFEGSVVCYKIFGSGRPVVLLHGFGEDGTVWDEQVSFLKGSFQLIVPDLPGSGESEILKKENIQISDYAEVIKEILSAENITTAVMIGHSMGGYISLAFAKKYPEQLSALGLFHSGAYADDVEKIATRKKGIQFIEANGSRAFLKTSIPGLFYDTEKSKSPLNVLIEKGSRFLPAALIQYYHAMIARPDTTELLKEFSKPVLFIIGEHDGAIPFAHSLQQSHIPAHSHIHILRNSAHMGMWEETGKANTILAQFLYLA
jgi:pimeloyl-ACP methyl ester carboxylesterase